LFHKPKSYRRACWPTQLDCIRETIFRFLGGAGPWNFYRRCARHWPRLASAHHPQTGSGVPKNFKGEHLKLGLKFHICVPKTLGIAGVVDLWKCKPQLIIDHESASVNCSECASMETQIRSLFVIVWCTMSEKWLKLKAFAKIDFIAFLASLGVK